MEDGNINILLIGRGAVISALAKKLHQSPNINKIYCASGNNIKNDIYENIDIRENDLTGLLRFALENNINLTIPVSGEAFDTDITSFFESNGQNIFAPHKNICNTILNKISCRKFLYKMQADSPKFGIFNKYQNAIDYLKNSSFPVLIKCDKSTGKNDDKLICPTTKYASDYIETLFTKGETDILIEDYIYGSNFTLYYITDGYNILPVTSVANYKFKSGFNEGYFTDGIGSYAPDYHVSQKIITKLNNLAHKIISHFETAGTPYVGILGIECIYKNENEIYIEDLKPFLQNHDAHTVLNLIDENLIKLFISCINGSFSDDYNHINTNNLCSLTILVDAEKENRIIEHLDQTEDLDNIDFINIKQENEIYKTIQGPSFTITRCSKTLTRAREYISQDLSVIKFDGMIFRKDICDKIS